MPRESGASSNDDLAITGSPAFAGDDGCGSARFFLRHAGFIDGVLKLVTVSLGAVAGRKGVFVGRRQAALGRLVGLGRFGVLVGFGGTNATLVFKRLDA